jgi:serine/threonine-protein kinase
MASVWCAEDRVLGRAVAVKVLADRFAHDEFAVRRFTREARTAARVSGHPHVVTIFDIGEIEPTDDQEASGPRARPRAFMVMEYLSGGTVADAIRVGAVERNETVRWLAQAASALDHAHKRGIVHRDIKPANFLLDNDRVLHVADFGIARLQSEDTITSSGELFGTAAYLSPEQALGGEATGASDRYSLAVAAFELLAGRRPFQATHFTGQARQHVEDEVPRASEVEPSLPPAVDEVLMQAMAKHPQDRYESAGAFVEALDQALKEPVKEPLTARTVPLDERAFAAELAAVGAAAVAAADDPDDQPEAESGGARPPRHRGDGSPAPAWSPIQPGSTPRRRSGRTAALAALAIVLIGVAALALLGHGSSKPSARIASQNNLKHKSTKSTKSTKTTPKHHRKRASTSPSSSTATAPASASNTSAASSSTAASAPTSADALQAQGHQELASGSYPQAISSLRQAVSSASPSSLTYAYALYDLGRALTLGGQPQAAIPVLEQRLRIPNQTPVVQQALNEARQAAGQSSGGGSAPTTSSSAPTTNSSPPTTTPAQPSPARPTPRHEGHHHGQEHGTSESGGAGLPPGQAKHGA